MSGLELAMVTIIGLVIYLVIRTVIVKFNNKDDYYKGNQLDFDWDDRKRKEINDAYAGYDYKQNGFKEEYK